MSRLRRPFLSNRYFFLTVKLRRWRSNLAEEDFPRLTLTLARMREKHGLLLTAWVFLPDHWHAILYPPYPLTISQAMTAVKVSSTISVNHSRGEAGELWQGRFFDHALRTVRDYVETVEYIHSNPVRRGLVNRPDDWKWSSVHEYARLDVEQERRCVLKIDRVRLPADENAPI